MAEVTRMTGVGRAAVQHWRRRHADFPTPIAGTDIHPRFERAAVVAWLLAHDKIAVPRGVPSATLTLWSDAAGERRFRLDDPVLDLADDETDDDHLSGWMADDAADALAGLTADTGVSVRRLAEPATPPLAVDGPARVIEQFRSGSGGLRITLAWPASLRGTAARGTGGGSQLRHVVPKAAPSPMCRCARPACGGLVPTAHCAEHSRADVLAMEWHPAKGVRCTHLARLTAP
ncbi:hypothetical protein [Streptomyces lateritius]|uniref:hypothetical protein n=1 Tax=Streptomyces lateritius TaxID=67313 RepID=UPI001C8B7C94|nr:hypothetical protein [Streptomyces lateritius]MBX9420833.1 hypothetical protein [Streptomyces lateritius]